LLFKFIQNSDIMDKIKIRLLSSFLAIFGVCEAQEKITISGKVKDNQTNEVLPFTSVTVNKETSETFVVGTITDEAGNFQIEGLALGNYSINISFVGYEQSQRMIYASGINTTFNLGVIPLNPTSETLEAVEVSVKREVTNAALSKKSFSLTDNIANSGGSVLEAMKSMPGVTFDQDGKVLLRGSDKVTVLIDGKQSSLTGFGNQKGLGNIPVSNIDRIEIINNPSAKYDANGLAGIINIIYKDEQERGLNGTVGLSSGIGAFSKRKEDLPTNLGSYYMNPKLIPSIDFNYRTKKFNYFLQSEFIIQEALPNNEYTTRFYNDGRKITSQVPENRKQFRTILKGGVDWNFNENNRFTFSGMYDREKHIDTSQVAFINLATSQRERYYNWREEEITSNINVVADYEHSFAQPGQTFNANMQYTRGLEDESYFLNDSSSIRLGRDVTHIKAVEHTLGVSANYAQALAAGKLEVGTKVRVRRLPVDYIVERGNNSIIYEGLGDYSDWGENLFAGYANFVYERAHFEIEAGLRAEYTEVFYTLDPTNIYYNSNDDYDYFKFFPSVRYTQKLNQNNNISLFYNRRIDRPGEAELRIFPKYDDPELLKVGNPYLRPQYTESIELAHKLSWTTGSLFSALYHKKITDEYRRIYSIDDSNPTYDIINRIYQNTGKTLSSGIEILFNQDISSYWELGMSANFFRNKVATYTGTVLFPYERSFYIEESKANATILKLTNEFQLPWELQFQVVGLYYSPKNIPQGKELSRSSVDIGVKKVVWNKKGEVAFSMSDIFNTYGIRQEINESDFTALYQNYYETQIARISFKYKF